MLNEHLIEFVQNMDALLRQPSITNGERMRAIDMLKRIRVDLEIRGIDTGLPRLLQIPRPATSPQRDILFQSG